MPTLPWTQLRTPEPDRTYVVMASRLPLHRHRTIPMFLAATVRIRRQLTHAAGLVGYGLDAQLLRRTFFTLSVWNDEQDIARFAHANPHEVDVESIRPHVDPTTFVTWTVRGRDLPVTWDEGKRRLREAAA